MKQLELELKERLLIVEYADKKEAELDLQTHKAFPESDKTVICLGPELTEEIAKGLLNSKRIKIVWDDFISDVYINYNHKKEDGYLNTYTLTALDSFISAIEAKGFYWGKNPIKHPDEISIQPASLNWWTEQEKSHLKAESVTFIPAKTLIFKIL